MEFRKRAPVAHFPPHPRKNKCLLNRAYQFFPIAIALFDFFAVTFCLWIGRIGGRCQQMFRSNHLLLNHGGVGGPSMFRQQNPRGSRAGRNNSQRVIFARGGGSCRDREPHAARLARKFAARHHLYFDWQAHARPSISARLPTADFQCEVVRDSTRPPAQSSQLR